MFIKKLPRYLTIVVILILVAAVVFLMQYVQNLLNEDARINLTEVVTQNKDVITSKFKVEINNLQNIAMQLADRLSAQEKTGKESLKSVFDDYSRTTEDKDLFVAAPDGMAFFRDGSTIDISGRRYFRLAKEGIQNISERIVSRQSGNEIFVISVPIMLRGEIYGTVQKSYSPEEMYAICSVSLFSSQGQMYIINKEGYILISSAHTEYSRESENYFRMLYAQGNQEAAKQLENDVQNNRSGFMETTIGGQKLFSAYTPIEELHDWYLISSISTSAVSANADIVIKLFYFILFTVVLIFALSMLYFLSYKNRQQANLEHIAFVDTVTGGNTFTKFAVDLRNTLAKYPEKQFYILKFDIDNFKYINNFYGFEYGDKLLKRIYKTIEGQLHQGEVIARISSDNFVVLLDNADAQRLDELHDLLRSEEGAGLYLSAGVYPILKPDESINLMVDKASTAAQTVKGSLHKHLEFYSEKFDQQIIHNEQMKQAVQQALQDDEIIPFFQPKVDVNTNKLAGAEALARWRTKEDKLIPPNDFIPICEKTGLIVELDMMIFEKTLKFLKRNMDDGINCVPISVNFSRLHLSSPDFPEKITSKLQEYNVPPRLIEIELTETVIFDNYEVITDLIAKLHDIGLLVSMDDFGSGYSSLNMLKDVLIDVLKIDRDFLKKASDISRRNIIFSTIAQMAKLLNIKIVVEGVETEENVELMKEVGCHIAQGYYFAKPLDEQVFENIFRKGSV